MKVNLHEPSFGEEEIMAATDQMRTTQVTMGKQVREFEEQCAEHFGWCHRICAGCDSESQNRRAHACGICGGDAVSHGDASAPVDGGSPLCLRLHHRFQSLAGG